MKTDISQKKIDWLLKSLAGVILGFMIAIACSGFFVWLTPSLAGSAQTQLAMWMVPPVWITILGVSFLFRTGWQAWLGLGVITVVLFSVLSLVR